MAKDFIRATQSNFPNVHKRKKRITNGDFIGALIISMPSITERAVRAKELHTNAGKEHVHRFLRLLQ